MQSLTPRTTASGSIGMLEKKKPDAPEAWKQRLPDMASRLEQTLYRESSSLVRARSAPNALMRKHSCHTP